MAVNTIERFALRVSQLYEQGAEYVRIGEYVRRWFRWVRFGEERYVNVNANDWVQTHMHPSMYEVCRLE